MVKLKPIIKTRPSDKDTIIVDDEDFVYIRRYSNGSIETNVPRRTYHHSPTGYNFGYAGSGPADFALNTLLMFCDINEALPIYQDFKFQFIAKRGEQKISTIGKGTYEILKIEKHIIKSFISEHAARVETNSDL